MLLVAGIGFLMVLAILGIVTFYHYQPKQLQAPSVNQENRGDHNQGAGTNNGTMNQINK